MHNGTKSIQSQVTFGVSKVMKNAFLILFAKDSNLFYIANDMIDDSHSNFTYAKAFWVHSWHLCLLMTNDIIQTNQFLAKLSLSLVPLQIHITTLIDEMHYNDIIMGTMASQITSISIVCSTVGSGADQRKHQSSASLAFVWGIHRWPGNSPHKRQVMWKMFPFDEVIM